MRGQHLRQLWPKIAADEAEAARLERRIRELRERVRQRLAQVDDDVRNIVMAEYGGAIAPLASLNMTAIARGAVAERARERVKEISDVDDLVECPPAPSAVATATYHVTGSDLVRPRDADDFPSEDDSQIPAGWEPL